MPPYQLGRPLSGLLSIRSELARLREIEGLLVVPRGGEMLFRVKQQESK